jgi:uncharacterized membrane protein
LQQDERRGTEHIRNARLPKLIQVAQMFFRQVFRFFYCQIFSPHAEKDVLHDMAGVSCGYALSNFSSYDDG